MREYNFITGVETGTLPSATTPTADADMITKGYADEAYIQSIADVAAVKAIAAADRFNGQAIWVEAIDKFFTFDSGSSATGDDISVITPTSGTGRWLKVVPEAGDTQTFSNKTFSDAITMDQIATPSSPASSKNKLYFKSDGSLYKLTSGGVESEVGAGGGLSDSPFELTNLSLAASVGSNALTISLKDKAGSNASASSAVKIAFRNATATTGNYVRRSVESSLSVVVSSGSTLGFLNNVSQCVYVYAIDNAGTVELAVAGRRMFDEGKLYSTTAEGGAGAADSAYTLYSTTARANVPIRYLGYVKSTQVTAGTWATAPSEITVNGDRSPKVLTYFRGHTANGHGNVNTKIRRVLTTAETWGDGFTYIDSSNDGGSWTINRNGTLTISGTEVFGVGQLFGISVDTTAATTDVQSLSTSERMMLDQTPSGDTPKSYSWTGTVKVGQVYRIHTRAGGDSSSPQWVAISITHESIST